MTTHAEQFDQVVTLALQLSTADQARLLERIAARVAQAVTDAQTAAPASPPAHWGQQMIARLDALDVSAWDDEAIDDPVAWVKRQRAEQQSARTLDWGEDS